MDIRLTETQRLLRDSVRDYLQKEVPFDRIRALEENGDYDRDLWRSLQSAGYLGLPFDEERGGGGGTLSDLAVVIEEITRRAAVIPFMETLLSAVTIERFAEPALAAEVVESVMAGSMTISPAVGGTPCAIQSDTINGGQRFLDYGAEVTHHLVDSSENGEPALYLVESAAPGLTMQPLRNLGRTPCADAEYTAVAGRRVAGAAGRKFLIHAGRALASVQCLGNAQQALDMTTEYASMRVQFGRPIGTFQAVQHHCADMATMTLAARFLAYQAVWGLEDGPGDARTIAKAKAWASKTATEVPMMAHQIHGGIGFTEEYDLHFFSRHGKERALAWGSAAECLGELADTLEELQSWQ